MDKKEQDLLIRALESGILDMSAIQAQVDMNKRKEILKEHKWAISCFSDGSWRTYLPGEDGKRKQIRRKTQKDLEDAIVEFYKKKNDVPTIKELFDEWNERRLMLGKISESTHARYQCVFNRHYNSIADTTVDQVTPAYMSDFLEKEVADKKLTAKGFSNLKTITKGMLQRAKKKGCIDWRVVDMLDDLELSDKDFHKSSRSEEDCVFNEAEMLKMMTHLKKNPDQYNLGIMLMFVTGIRVGELVALKHSDFRSNLSFEVNRTESRYNDRNTHSEVVTVKERPKTEAGIRLVVVPEEYEWLIKKIRSLNPFSEFVLYRKDGNRMQTEDIRHRLYLNCEKIGMKKNKSPHKIRMTYGSILLDNNVSEKIVERQMGHTSIDTTRKYYYKDRKNVEDKIKAVSSISELTAAGEN